MPACHDFAGTSAGQALVLLRSFVGSWCLVLAACVADEPSRILHYDVLMSGSRLDAPVPMAEFSAPDSSRATGHSFSGYLQIGNAAQTTALVLKHDEFGLETPERPGIDQLPAANIRLVQDGDLLIPLEQGPIDTGHEWWDLVLRTGRVWDEPGDRGLTRAAVPFALKERREDCIHNGVLSFLFGADGEVSRVAFQISQQTCRYIQFDLYGMIGATYTPEIFDDAPGIVAQVKENRQSRLPVQPIGALARNYPDSRPREFGSSDEIDPDDMTLYGFVIDGTHYVGGCDTPYGPYPFCDEMALPSYSTAKSLVGGFGLMLMEARYPGTASESIGGLVPECGETWDAVTIEHALDMTTGHFESPEMHADEDSGVNSAFFNADTHAGKVDFACNAYQRSAEPGARLVYRSWDTYLAGTAMNRHLQSLQGPDADFYSDLVVDVLWQPLNLSLLSRETRRTYDDVQQPFTGFGLTFVRDDVAKLVQFIGPDDGRIDGEVVLDQSLFDSIKQRNPDDPGMVAELDTIRYNNGFRSFDVSSYIDCEDPVWVVVLSGFGGIIFAIMPNDTAYYYFSDGNVHRYLHAIKESHRIRPMCESELTEAVQ